MAMTGNNILAITVVLLLIATEMSSVLCQRQPTSSEAKREKIIKLDGNAYVAFSFHKLQREYLLAADIEEFSFYFNTLESEGLMWTHKDTSQKMYFALKNGHLIFVNQETGRPAEEVSIGEGLSFNDNQWHKVKVDRKSQVITITVDDKLPKTFRFSGNPQFLRMGQIWLGGAPKVEEETSSRIKLNFKGSIGRVLYQTQLRRGNKHIRNKVNLIAKIKETDFGTGVEVVDIMWPSSGVFTVVTTDRPRPKLTSVTLKTDPAYIDVPKGLRLRIGSSMSFKFRTFKPKGLLMYCANSPRLIDVTFIAMEIYDGNLYFIHNFGGVTKRTLFTGGIGCNDGQTHTVNIKFYNPSMTLSLDSYSNRLMLDTDESLSDDLGTLYIGGYTTPTHVPWHTWAREGYQGCIEDVNVNGDLIDLEPFVSNQIVSTVERQCISMPQFCTQRPCRNGGKCTDMWSKFECDCAGTDYMGIKCEIPAWTGVFNGTNMFRMTLRPQQHYHHDDISFRFKTRAQYGLLFQTRSRTGNGYMRGELEEGRMKIRTNLGGHEQTFYMGDGLNDDQWHSCFIQRRGKHIEMWVDDERHTSSTLPSEDYFHNVNDLFIGGYSDGTNPHGGTKNFLGYIRNIRMGSYNIFDELEHTGNGPFYKDPEIPHLIFGEVTFPDYDSNVQLPSLNSASGLNINFQFKTFDESGIIMLNEGSGKELFVVELFQGRIYVKIHKPGNAPFEVVTPVNLRYNDGKWHSVTIRERGQANQGQLLIAIGNMKASHSYSGLDRIHLKGPLYIGGVPSSVLRKPHVKEVVSSTNGFRGCLASVQIRKSTPDLHNLGKSQGANILRTCQEIRSKCTEDTCKKGGICHDHLSDGSTWCDCNKTAYAGPICLDEPLGYYFSREGNPRKNGMMSYRYPTDERPNNERDEIVFGVMTDEKNGVLARLQSYTFDDFIEFKLVNGYVVAMYDTDGGGSPTTITNSEVDVSDGRYHVVRFVRTADMGILTINELKTINSHLTPHSNFDNLDRIYIGGVYDKRMKQMVNGTGFRGIIGGMYVNGDLIFPFAKRKIRTIFYNDTNEAPIPYKLGPPISTTKPEWVTLPTIKTKPELTVPPIVGIPEIPDDYGGGGIAWGISPSGGLSVVTYPDGSGGTVVGIPAAVKGIQVAGASSVIAIPAFPAHGQRAGALIGTILGGMLLASSLMWAFYGCKPGGQCCGFGSSSPAVSISSPSGSAGPPGTTPLLSKVEMTHIDSGGIGMGGSRGDVVDGTEMTNVDTMDGRGSVKTMHVQRNYLGSTASESYPLFTPASLKSYHYEGHTSNSTTADYDLASGVYPSYKSNTLPLPGAGGRGMSTGYSTSTLASNYNYTVKSIRSVGGALSNVIVTPGAMGEEIRVDCCLMTNDGHSVVTGSSLGPPQVWNMSDGELLRIMHGETVGSTFLHLVCDDKLLVGAINADLDINQHSIPKGVHNYFFQIWDCATCRPLEMAEQEICSALTVMSDSDKVVFGHSDMFGAGTNIVVWDLLGNQALKEMRYDAPIGNNDYISYIALSQSDRYVVAGFTNTFDNYAEYVIFDMTLTSFSVSDPHILRLDAVPECTAIMGHDEAVTGLRNGDLVIWSLKTGQPERQLVAYNGRHAHTREIKAVARSEDNRYLVSASADGTLRVWDMEQEQLMHTLSGHHDEVWCCTISVDGEIIASGSRDGNIRLWKLRTGREICAFNAGVDLFYITMSKDKGTIVALGDKYGARKLVMLQVVRSKVKRQVLV